MFSAVHVCWVVLTLKIKSKWLTRKKPHFSSSANVQYILMKFLWFGPWLSRVDGCKGHWCGSTYVVERLSDIGSKTGKKCVFCVFRLVLSLCQTASKPYRLSHTNALCINQFYKPKDQSIKFSWKTIENWRSWKMRFFWGGHFEFSKSAILNFFLLHLCEKSSPFIWGIIFFCNMDGSSRILKKTSFQFFCTRLYVDGEMFQIFVAYLKYAISLDYGQKYYWFWPTKAETP